MLALPSRRLRGDYFAIVTLFFLEIFNNFTTNGYAWNWFGFGAPHDITGGPTGINNVDPFRVFGHGSRQRPTDYVWVAAARLHGRRDPPALRQQVANRARLAGVARRSARRRAMGSRSSG